MLKCVPIKKWAVLVPSSMAKMTERFVTVLQNTCKSLGITLSAPFYIQVENDEINSISKELKILLNKEKPQIVFCILASNREDRYRAIKKLCTVDYGGILLDLHLC
jgi:aubergine